MKVQKKKQNGITLIALVISIIVILILAGISLNVVVGDNGILTQALKAKASYELASIKEEIEYILINYSSSRYAGKSEGLLQFLANEKNQNKIENFAVSSDEDYALIVIGDKTFQIERESEYNYKIMQEIENLGNENLEEILGTTILTPKTIEQMGAVNFEPGGEYTIIADEINGKDIDFIIPAGEPVTIKIMHDLKINNSEKPNKSAIEIKPGATLNLYVYGTTTVNSGYGVQGTTASSLGAEGGPGGHAGIHVPWIDNNGNGLRDSGEYAILNLYGTGTLIAYGGNAGAGGGAVSNNTGGGRWWPEQELVLVEMVEKVGQANTTFAFYEDNDLKNAGFTTYKIGRLTNSGSDGGNGEACGEINICENLEVYAFGGAGGAGGHAIPTWNVNGKIIVNSGSGAGGYPAAGIGGGGAGGGGGEHCYAAGGYTVGNSEAGSNSDGKNGSGSLSGSYYQRSGGYYTSGSAININGCYFNQGQCWHTNLQNTTGGHFILDHAGSGGNSGAGGNIYYFDSYDISKLHAYNGNMITEENFNYSNPYYGWNENGTEKTSGTPLTVITRPDEKKIIPAYIFSQAGNIRPVYYTNQHMSREEATLYNVSYIFENDSCSAEYAMINAGNSNNPTTSYGQGIGSGAGNLEKSNGFFKPMSEK